MHADKQPQKPSFFLPPRKSTEMIRTKTELLFFARALNRFLHRAYFAPYAGLYVCLFVFSVRTAYTFTRLINLSHFATNSIHFKNNHLLFMCLSDIFSVCPSVRHSIPVLWLRKMSGVFCKQIDFHFTNGREKKKKKKKNKLRRRVFMPLIHF